MKKVTEYPEFITPKECKSIIDILDKRYVPGTGIREDAEAVNEILKIFRHKLPEFDFTNHLSTGNTREAIIKHTDPLLDNRVTHKLLIYLNKVSSGGGTFFENLCYVKPEVGKAVIFDIKVPHWGEGFPKGEMKRVFGLRMFLKDA